MDLAPRESALRVIICGFGGVGRALFRLLAGQRLAVPVVVIGLTDSGGYVLRAATDPLELDEALECKACGSSVATLRGGCAGGTALAMLQVVPAAGPAAGPVVLCEATPTHLPQGGEPALSTVLAALARGINVVLTNKAPLALAFARVAAAARASGAQLRFSSCVGGALPSVNIGARDLCGSTVLRIDAILNLSTQMMLRMMEDEEGVTVADAQRRMQSRGLLEADPSLDVDGFDSAFKLVILAHAVLRDPIELSSVRRQGIGSVSVADVQQAAQAGKRLCLVCTAERTVDGSYVYSVAPVAVPRTDHPLGRLSGAEMGIVYTTDVAGVIVASSVQTDCVPTASAMIRDIADVVRELRL